jgi:hypothetical protein
MATKTKHARPVPAIPALDAPSALPRQSGTPSNGDSLAEGSGRHASWGWCELLARRGAGATQRGIMRENKWGRDGTIPGLGL